MQATIVIPCYNEASRLKKEVFLSFFETNDEVDFLFVNDGSSDDTLMRLQEFSAESPRVHYLDLQSNGGKAEAVRQGMIYAEQHFESEYIGFWDADLATPLFEIRNFMLQMELGNFDMVTGLRLLRLGAKVRRKRSRHLLGRVFATVASTLIKLPVYDTQCGAKLYKRKIVPVLFSKPFITKWLFDVEILFRYKKEFGSDAAINLVYEYPVMEWADVDGSQLKMRDFIKAPYELYKIKRKYK